MAYYVYIHRFSNGTFYIGKGTKNRWLNNKRNSYWHNLKEKNGEPIRGIFRGSLSELDAFHLEITLISLFKEAGLPLCNLTNGGEGISGYKHFREALLKIKIASIGNTYSNPDIFRKINEERTDKTEYDFVHPIHGCITTYPANLAKQFNLSNSNVHLLVRGIYANLKGWCIKGNIKVVRGKLYEFKNNKTSESRISTLIEFDAFLGLSKGSAGKLILGKKKQTRSGWEFEKEITNA